MKKYNPEELKPAKLHEIILGCISPRPIAFASTIDKNNIPNLAPFSFFNAFGINPTTLIFSPARRGTDNTTKDTYHNLKDIPEVVINVVTYDLVQQVNVSSNNFPADTNEFIKSGLTPIDSHHIKPYRVKESPVQFECKVRQIIETGNSGGAGNLIVSEIICIHLNTEILTKDELIDPNKLKLVGRMGADHYCKAFGSAIFDVPKPGMEAGIGIDNLPEKIKNSNYLKGFDLGILGNEINFPNKKELKDIKTHPFYIESLSSANREQFICKKASELLLNHKIREGFALLTIYTNET
ncbi:MAG: flavin reductase family protein [Bacteroidales bacterium]